MVEENVSRVLLFWIKRQAELWTMKLELQDHNDLNDVNANKYEMYSGLEFVF
jgi:hypothetical protein